jgi:predicted Fe-Mo cluster-binding NifX family protein
MKIVVSSQGNDLEAPTSPVFGRCPTFMLVDTETMAFEAVANPAIAQGGGAGIQAAQYVVNLGAQAVLTGNLGPNAFDVLRAAEVPGYIVPAGSVREAVRAFKAGTLQPMGGASVAAHAGMGRGRQAPRAPHQGREGAPGQAEAQPEHESELEKLRETLKNLRKQLAETMARIEKLEQEVGETEEN